MIHTATLKCFFSIDSIVSSIKVATKRNSIPFSTRLVFEWIFPILILNDVYDFAANHFSHSHWYLSHVIFFSLLYEKKNTFQKSNDKQFVAVSMLLFLRYVWLRACMHFLQNLIFAAVTCKIQLVYIPCFYCEFNEFITSSTHSCVWMLLWLDEDDDDDDTTWKSKHTKTKVLQSKSN